MAAPGAAPAAGVPMIEQVVAFPAPGATDRVNIKNIGNRNLNLTGRKSPTPAAAARSHKRLAPAQASVSPTLRSRGGTSLAAPAVSSRPLSSPGTPWRSSPKARTTPAVRPLRPTGQNWGRGADLNPRRRFPVLARDHRRGPPVRPHQSRGLRGQVAGPEAGQRPGPVP